MVYTKLTISGLICTGKTTLFWELNKQLSWPVFSASSYFRDYARAHKISLERAEEQSEKITREVDMQMRKLLVSSEKIIVEGWMAGIMAAGMKDVLRVLLVCGEQERIRRFAMREKVSIEEAERSVLGREKNLFAKLGAIYSRDDFVEKKYYDLIADTTGLIPAEVVAKVMEKISL